MDLNSFGKNLQFNKRGTSSQPIEELSDKEMFIRIVGNISKCWNDSNELYNTHNISLLEYEEGYYQIIEDLLNVHYGPWKSELILWYIFGRVDSEGNIYPLTMRIKGKEDEEIYLKTPLQLWNFLEKIEKQKRKDEK